MMYLVLAVANYVGLSNWDFFITFLPTILLDYTRAISKATILPIHEALRKRPKLTKSLLISVIIPAHNEEKTIATCIESVLENTYPYKEIIVIDDGSTDRTYAVASRYKDRIKLLRRPKGGIKAYALNYGLKFAKGDVIVTVDADTIISRDALERIAEYMSNPKVIAASGNLRVYNHNKNILTKTQSYEYVVGFDIGRRLQALFRTLLIIPGAKSIIRRDVILSIGGFDPVLGEDFDLTLKVHKIRGRVVFIPDCYAFTDVPESWRPWLRQRERWHRSQLSVLIKHRNIFFRRVFGPPGIYGAPDMVLMDVLAIIIRPAWFAYFAMTQNLLSFFVPLILFYAIVELHTTLSVLSVVEEPSDFRYAYLFPVMLLVYRPIYSFVRRYAYIYELIKPSLRW